jgi:hypothetical protein
MTLAWLAGAWLGIDLSHSDYAKFRWSIHIPPVVVQLVVVSAFWQLSFVPPDYAIAAFFQETLSYTLSGCVAFWPSECSVSGVQWGLRHADLRFFTANTRPQPVCLLP